MQKDASDQLEKIFIDHEKSKSHLEARRQRLELVEKELKEREALNTSEKKRLDHEKKMVLPYLYSTQLRKSFSEPFGACSDYPLNLPCIL